MKDVGEFHQTLYHLTELLGNSGMCGDLGELGRSRTNTPGDTEGWLFPKRQSASAVKRKSNLTEGLENDLAGKGHAVCISPGHDT